MKKYIWGVEIKHPGQKPEPLDACIVWNKKDAQEFMHWYIELCFKDHKKNYKNDEAHLDWLKQIKTRVRKYALSE